MPLGEAFLGSGTYWLNPDIIDQLDGSAYPT